MQAEAQSWKQAHTGRGVAGCGVLGYGGIHRCPECSLVRCFLRLADRKGDLEQGA